MDENIAKEILNELLSSLEAVETQSAAILQFLKEKGLASDQELAPHLDQAEKASSVRWVAARARIDRLVSAAIKASEQKTQDPATTKQPEASGSKEPERKKEKEEAKPKSQTASPEAGDATALGGNAQERAEENQSVPMQSEQSRAERDQADRSQSDRGQAEQKRPEPDDRETRKEGRDRNEQDRQEQNQGELKQDDQKQNRGAQNKGPDKNPGKNAA